MTIPCHIFFPLGTIASERFPTYHQKRNHEKDPCRVGFAATTPPAALPGPARPGELRPICASSGHAGGLFFRAGFGRKDRQRRPGRRAFCRDEKLRRFDAASENASQRRAFGGRLCQRFRLRQRCPAEPDALESRNRGQRRLFRPQLSAQRRSQGLPGNGTPFSPSPTRSAIPPFPRIQKLPSFRAVARNFPGLVPRRPSGSFLHAKPPRLFRGIRRAASLLSPPHAPHQHPRCLPDSSPPASPFPKDATHLAPPFKNSAIFLNNFPVAPVPRPISCALRLPLISFATFAFPS